MRLATAGLRAAHRACARAPCVRQEGVSAPGGPRAGRPWSGRSRRARPAAAPASRQHPAAAPGLQAARTAPCGWHLQIIKQCTGGVDRTQAWRPGSHCATVRVPLPACPPALNRSRATPSSTASLAPPPGAAAAAPLAVVSTGPAAAAVVSSCCNCRMSSRHSKEACTRCSVWLRGDCKE